MDSNPLKRSNSIIALEKNENSTPDTIKEYIQNNCFVVRRLCHPIEAYMILYHDKGVGGWDEDRSATLSEQTLADEDYTKQKGHNESGYNPSSPRNTPWDKLSPANYQQAWGDLAALFKNRQLYEFYQGDLAFNWPGVTLTLIIDKKYIIDMGEDGDVSDDKKTKGRTFLARRGAPIKVAQFERSRP
ncbi:hypothetical protein [Pseudoalteromonas sp. Of7M-16]|uniref:hypothetical protein n=1 Tax=Pseudoalteromonas sp. Of7M-16 TaxID=2917756 RepID=UPI001EF751BD|nr:hypothetical protein [Pseudoalteromonas sp. Of7M-16]MCG7550730.1 hypothetical protein [Pseudoalteromonas sp. Of7M-16]